MCVVEHAPVYTRVRGLKRVVTLVCFISAMRDRIVHSVGKVLKVCCAMNALFAQCVL